MFPLSYPRTHPQAKTIVDKLVEKQWITSKISPQ